MPPLRVDLVRQVDRAGPLIEEWRGLALAASNPFALPEWHACWLQTHPAERPFLLTCRDGESRLVAVVPLVVRRRLGVRVLSGAGSAYADWFGPACTAGRERAVASAVASALPRLRRDWDVWRVDRCLADSGWEQGLLAHRRSARGVRVLPFGRPATLIVVPVDGDALVERKAKDRREHERLGRRLVQRHGAHAALSEGGAVRAHLEALLDLHRERWGAAIDPGARHFLVALGLALAAEGLLRLWVVEVDGGVAAALLGMRSGHQVFAYIQAFDLAFARSGVGLWLLVHAARAAAQEHGVTRFNMLRGDEPHKQQFRTTQQALRSYLVVKELSVLGFVAGAVAALDRGYGRLPEQRRQVLRRVLRGRLREPRRATRGDDGGA